jgi:hypothetical protein
LECGEDRRFGFTFLAKAKNQSGGKAPQSKRKASPPSSGEGTVLECGAFAFFSQPQKPKGSQGGDPRPIL